MINKSQILAKYARREASAEEQKAFQDWLQTLTPAQLEEVVDEYGALVAELPGWEGQADPELLATVHREIAAQETAPAVYRLPFLYRWGWAAAVLLGLILVGGYWLQKGKPTGSGVATAEDRIKTDIPPGKNGAVLTLADGRQVLLDTLDNGTVALQSGHAVIVNNGQLAYKAAAGGKNTGRQPLFNTLSTPTGRQYRLALSDGTQVWLNAASSIRYPAEFRGPERIVEVSG